MGKKHSQLSMLMFPNQKGTGVDYGNIEFKESTKNHQCYDLYPKDEKTEYFLFTDFLDYTFRLVDKQDIPVIKNHRKITTMQIDRICIWNKTNVVEVKEIIDDMKKEFDERK